MVYVPSHSAYTSCVCGVTGEGVGGGVGGHLKHCSCVHAHKQSLVVARTEGKAGSDTLFINEK